MAGTFRCDGDARAAARDLLAELTPLELNSKLAVDAVLVARPVRALARGFASCRLDRDADQSPQERAHLRRTGGDIRGSEGKVHRHVGFSSMTWASSSRSLCFCSFHWLLRLWRSRASRTFPCTLSQSVGCVTGDSRCKPGALRPAASSTRPAGRAPAKAMTTRATEKNEATTALALSQRSNATRSAQDGLR